MGRGVKAYITPSVLKWARESIGLSVEIIAQKLRVSVKAIELWELGKDYPSFATLKKMAKIYQRHYSLFFLSKPPKRFRPLQDYRTLDSIRHMSSQDDYRLKANIIEAYKRRKQAISLYKLLNIKLTKIGFRCRLDEPINIVAERIRSYFNIDKLRINKKMDAFARYKFWKRVVEKKDIIVSQTSLNTHLAIDIKQMRGFCIADDILPIITINPKDSPNGRIFTIFHEIVHLALRASSISNIDFREINLQEIDPIEVFCNKVAAEVLVPAKELEKNTVVANHSTLKWSIRDIQKIALSFGVSDEVIFRRLLTIGKTNNYHYKEFRKSRKIKEKVDSGYPPYFRKIISSYGENYIKLVFMAYYSEKICTNHLSELLGKSKLNHINKVENAIFSG